MISKDTHPAIGEKYNQMLLNTPSAERLRMGCNMFDTAKAFVQSSIPGTCSPLERRIALLRRFYSSDLPQEYQDRLIACWRETSEET